MEEKRRYPRFLTWNLAYIKRAYTPIELTLPMQPVRVLNISEKGMLIEFNEHNLGVGDKVKIDLLLMKVYELEGTVKWTSEEYVGIEFNEPQPEVVQAAKEFRQAAIEGWQK
ncbi:MAG TPA: PilZ domain-containing protein [Candidatus Desulfofervidus auxilii]|uniref:PilZ domain-containing protein n=1 Tax=Desulfofervidus auxilii TaxID=1621989 RepID=A0A7C0U348_DESA2|nr:PilZ domain-containing protein [Candidatus Desulfofervidus auxilii]